MGAQLCEKNTTLPFYAKHSMHKCSMRNSSLLKSKCLFRKEYFVFCVYTIFIITTYVQHIQVYSVHVLIYVCLCKYLQLPCTHHCIKVCQYQKTNLYAEHAECTQSAVQLLFAECKKLFGSTSIHLYHNLQMYLIHKTQLWIGKLPWQSNSTM